MGVVACLRSSDTCEESGNCDSLSLLWQQVVEWEGGGLRARGLSFLPPCIPDLLRSSLVPHFLSTRSCPETGSDLAGERGESGRQGRRRVHLTVVG